jgi:hypothetical protein
MLSYRLQYLLIVLIALILFGLLPQGITRAGYAQSIASDRQTLLAGVTQVGVNNGAVPGPLALFAPDAFAVVTTTTNEGVRAPVVAAAPLGAGRVVAFGHGSFFNAVSRQIGQTGQLILNSVCWSARAQQPLVAVKISGSDQPALIAFLQAQGFQTQALQSPVTSAQLVGVGAVIIDIGSPTASEIAAVQSYVTNGGGLVASGIGWPWVQSNPGISLVNHPGNQLLAPAGIAWAGSYISGTLYPVEASMPPLITADSALDLVLSPDLGTAAPADVTQAVGALRLVASILPATETRVWGRAQPLITSASTAVPTIAAPLKGTSQPRFIVGRTFLLQRQLQQPPSAVTALPAANDFPGAVPAAAARVTRTISIDASASQTASGARWYSTGLYAAPGEAITIDIPVLAAAKKLSVRIGAHSDQLWGRSEWWRVPQIDHVVPLSTAQTVAASAFGGLIYLVVPAGSDLGSITITISGGVEAPRFVLGQTSLTTWRDQIRHFPAPWAELESANLILTVQSAAIRTLDSPDTVLQFWDRVQEANRDLAGWPVGKERPMRMVFDRQISAGYMHAGYPVMAYTTYYSDTPQSDALTLASRPPAEAAQNSWGFFHELGHNHQNGDWTFNGTTEVTVNLFTMYAIEQVYGAPKEVGLADVSHETQRQYMINYFSRGAKFDQWKLSPFTGLAMYIQLIDAFGWDSFKTVFREYLALSAAERPADDAAKRDQWMVRYSQTVGRNLGPFFDAWGIPTTAAARQSIASLPAWMPEPDFPKAYQFNLVFLPLVSRR